MKLRNLVGAGIIMAGTAFSAEIAKVNEILDKVQKQCMAQFKGEYKKIEKATTEGTTERQKMSAETYLKYLRDGIKNELPDSKILVDGNIEIDYEGVIDAVNLEFRVEEGKGNGKSSFQTRGEINEDPLANTVIDVRGYYGLDKYIEKPVAVVTQTVAPKKSVVKEIEIDPMDTMDVKSKEVFAKYSSGVDLSEKDKKELENLRKQEEAQARADEKAEQARRAELAKKFAREQEEYTKKQLELAKQERKTADSLERVQIQLRAEQRRKDDSTKVAELKKQEQKTLDSLNAIRIEKERVAKAKADSTAKYEYELNQIAIAKKLSQDSINRANAKAEAEAQARRDGQRRADSTQRAFIQSEKIRRDSLENANLLAQAQAKRIQDSTIAAQRVADSLSLVQKRAIIEHIQDSIIAVAQAKVTADSLTKVEQDRIKLAMQRAKIAQDSLDKALAEQAKRDAERAKMAEAMSTAMYRGGNRAPEMARSGQMSSFNVIAPEVLEKVDELDTNAQVVLLETIVDTIRVTPVGEKFDVSKFIAQLDSEAVAEQRARENANKKPEPIRFDAFKELGIALPTREKQPAIEQAFSADTLKRADQEIERIITIVDANTFNLAPETLEAIDTIARGGDLIFRDTITKIDTLLSAVDTIATTTPAVDSNTFASVTIKGKSPKAKAKSAPKKDIPTYQVKDIKSTMLKNRLTELAKKECNMIPNWCKFQLTPPSQTEIKNYWGITNIHDDRSRDAK